MLFMVFISYIDMTSLTLYIFIAVPSAADKMESHGVNILDSIMAYNSSAKSQLRLPG
jgi:hypothetical protein